MLLLMSPRPVLQHDIDRGGIIDWFIREILLVFLGRSRDIPEERGFFFPILIYLCLIFPDSLVNLIENARV